REAFRLQLDRGRRGRARAIEDREDRGPAPRQERDARARTMQDLQTVPQPRHTLARHILEVIVRPRRDPLPSTQVLEPHERGARPIGPATKLGYSLESSPGGHRLA